jgi:hypothetical protein
MNEQSIAYEVPLHERLDTVPPNARLIIEDENGLGTTYIPIGREAKFAAAELRRLHEVNQELVEALVECERYGGGYTNCEESYLPPFVRDKIQIALAKVRGTE